MFSKTKRFVCNQQGHLPETYYQKKIFIGELHKKYSLASNAVLQMKTLIKTFS